MTTASHIEKDLRDLQAKIHEQELSLKNLFTAIYVSMALSRQEGVSMIVRSGQELSELYRQEKALVALGKLKESR